MPPDFLAREVLLVLVAERVVGERDFAHPLVPAVCVQDDQTHSLTLADELEAGGNALALPVEDEAICGDEHDAVCEHPLLAVGVRGEVIFLIGVGIGHPVLDGRR